MLEKNCSLQPYNTFGIDVEATAFDRFSSVSSLENCLKNNTTGLELLIVGGGSNILLTKNFDGLVLKNEIKGFEVISENDQTVIVQVIFLYRNQILIIIGIMPFCLMIY